MITEVTTGSYRIPLAAGLRELNEPELAKQVEDRIVKIGFIAGLRTNDKPLPEASPKAIMALRTQSAQAEANSEVLGYYTQLLVTGISCLSVAGGLYPISGAQSHYAPGELFFKS